MIQALRHLRRTFTSLDPDTGRDVVFAGEQTVLQVQINGVWSDVPEASETVHAPDLLKKRMQAFWPHPGEKA